MSAAERITVVTRDGFGLAATLYEPPRRSGPAVLVAGALGVPQRRYAAFCAWLAERGHLVMSFDLRGIGDSRPAGSMRSVDIDMLGWARLDFAAAVARLHERAGAGVVVVGHSLGAHHPGMTDAATQARIARVVAVAAGSGYWRDWAAPSRRRAPLLLHVAGPIATRLFGYFPGARLRMLADLPGGVMRQWSRWCRHPGFAWGAEPDAVRPALQAARFPIASIGFTDDESMTEHCLRELLAAHPAAPSRIEMIDPVSLGVARIGHLGAFRPEMAGTLWPRLHAAIAAA